MSTTDNVAKLAIPLKHPEDTYIFTHTPEFPGPLTIQIISSNIRVHMLPTKAKNMTTNSTTATKKETLPITLPLVPFNKGKKCSMEPGE